MIDGYIIPNNLVAGKVPNIPASLLLSMHKKVVGAIRFPNFPSNVVMTKVV